MGLLQSVPSMLGLDFLSFKKEADKSGPDRSPAGAARYDRLAVPPNREVLLTWESNERVFVPRSNVYYKKVASIVLVICAMLLILGQFLFVGMILSLCVLYYVMSSKPPMRVKHEIDNYGIHYLGKQYYWEEFRHFFFTKEEGVDILNINMYNPIPGRLILLLEGVDMNKVKEVVGKHLSLLEVPPITMFEKLYKDITSKIAIE